MSEINLKVRFGTDTLYSTKVIIDLKETVIMLKTKICENDENLQESLIEIVYCGNIMDNSSTIYSYDVFEGATLHVYKRIKQEKSSEDKPMVDGDLVKLGIAFRSLSFNSSYRGALVKLGKPEVINNIILTTPGLNNDPVALTLLQHSELLVKLSDFEVVKRISESHPSLASAALKIAAAVHEEVLQNNFSTDVLTRSILNNASDDDIDDIDDSSPASEASSQPVSRNSSFGAITAAQLASAIASVTTQQPQPSTSGASTSTGNTVNNLETADSNHVSDNQIDYSTQLQIMREMGLTNEAVNLEALRLRGNLESAIELVLTGFTISNSRNNV